MKEHTSGQDYTKVEMKPALLTIEEQTPENAEQFFFTWRWYIECNIET